MPKFNQFSQNGVFGTDSSDPEEKHAERGKELCEINNWKYCCRLLILQSARVLARDSESWTRIFAPYHSG